MLEGELDVDFYGGQQPSSGGRTFPLLRVRRAIAELTWNRVALLVGQESPPIAAVSPSSIASVGFPDFAGAGNLWLWIPQIRLERRSPPERRRPDRRRDRRARADLRRSAGRLPHPTRHRRAERPPVLQGRVRGRWGQGDRLGEVSAGGHYGWILDAAGDRVPSKALALSVWTPLGPRSTSARRPLPGRRSPDSVAAGSGRTWWWTGCRYGRSGGWAQLNVRPSEQWEIGGGGGIDDPDDEDLGDARDFATWRSRAT